jgi:hypothetical protein
MTMNTFPLPDIRQLRERAAKAREISALAPEGWSKSSINPMDVLAVFEPLRIKEGYILRAYQHREGNDGRGVVWAMPVDSEFPEPQHCPLSENSLLGPPKPPTALEDFMKVVEGDGSPWSHFCASLLGRELRELGAALHGCNWTPHVILDKNPLSEPSQSDAIRRSPSGCPEHWTWLEPEPSQWPPHVFEDGNSQMVEFLTFSGYHREAIYHHADRFLQGSYRFTTQSTLVASGPSGYVVR